jgi:dihydrofolate reductase
MSENYVIGHKGKLPWDIPEDLNRFKKLTMGNTVVMGRKTYESIGRPLVNRYNIVVSSSLRTNLVHVVESLEDAIKCAVTENIFIIGGQKLYEEALDRAEYIFLTLVHKQIVGDTFFPEFSEDEWKVVEIMPRGEFSYVTLRREND